MLIAQGSNLRDIIKYKVWDLWRELRMVWFDPDR